MLASNIENTVEGFIKVYSVDEEGNRHLELDTHNAIHYENMSVAIANSLAHKSSGWIHEMAFGNGGSTVGSTGLLQYLEPNTTGQSATLYNETFSKVVDDESPLNLNPDDNNMQITHVTNRTYTDILVTCTLEYGEPAGQASFDTGTDTEAAYVFDELGLKSYNPSGDGLLLTHAVFSPIQKSLNRAFIVEYTIRISMC